MPGAPKTKDRAARKASCHPLDGVETQQADACDCGAPSLAPSAQCHTHTNAQWEEQQAQPFRGRERSWVEFFSDKEQEQQADAADGTSPRNPTCDEDDCSACFSLIQVGQGRRALRILAFPCDWITMVACAPCQVEAGKEFGAIRMDDEKGVCEA